VLPKQILHGDQTLRYGPLYTVRAGDTLVTIAAHFETTLKKLLSVNPQIVQKDEILPGDKKHVCYCVCAYSALAIGPFFCQLHLPPNTTTNITAYLPVSNLIAVVVVVVAAAAAVTVGTHH
jgi:hypothetical protein